MWINPLFIKIDLTFVLDQHLIISWLHELYYLILIKHNSYKGSMNADFIFTSE